MTEEGVEATEIAQRKVCCGLEHYFPVVHPSWRPTPLRDERRLPISEALALPKRNATSKKKEDLDNAAQLAKALLITTLEGGRAGEKRLALQRLRGILEKLVQATTPCNTNAGGGPFHITYH